VRANPYTEPAFAFQRAVSSAPEELMSQALAADIVTFGSPSAVKAWVALAGMEGASEKVRSGRACLHPCHVQRSEANW